jgi:hypothetical protein
MVKMVVDMQDETTVNLTETNLDGMQFCKEMPSEGSPCEAAVMMEERKVWLLQDSRYPPHHGPS